jgi:L-serine deaminase
MADLMIGKTSTGLKLPVLVDTTGQLMVSGGGGGGGGSTDMSVTNGILTTTAADTAIIKENTAKVAGYSIPTFDYKAFTYSGSNIATIVFKDGGSSGTTVATLTFGYTSGNLTSITKS